jgi:nitrogen PTS system EIIA component
MAQEDFDIDRLAAYLHMMPAAVAKLAERGKLPGRRVGGEWRFSAAEIHHWLEERIGLSDDDQLAQVEGALDRASDAPADEEVSICDLLRIESIAVPLDARTRGSVIEKMAELAARTHLLWDAAKMAEAVRAREAMHSTALDNGVALLHPRRPMAAILSEAVLALGISPGGIPFGSDGRRTDIFFLICSTSDHEHLRILARLSRIINGQEFLSSMRASESAASLHQLICDREAAIRQA